MTQALTPEQLRLALCGLRDAALKDGRRLYFDAASVRGALGRSIARQGLDFPLGRVPEAIAFFVWCGALEHGGRGGGKPSGYRRLFYPMCASNAITPKRIAHFYQQRSTGGR